MNSSVSVCEICENFQKKQHNFFQKIKHVRVSYNEIHIDFPKKEKCKFFMTCQCQHYMFYQFQFHASSTLVTKITSPENIS